MRTVEQGLKEEFKNQTEILARALRAVREQARDNEEWANIRANFIWSKTKEGHRYWKAIHHKEPKPDKFLPKGYIDAEAANEDLNRYRLNAEEDYLTTPISVLRYISELENALGIKQEEKP